MSVPLYTACLSFIFTMFLVLAVLLLHFLQFHSSNTLEKNLPFECGFSMMKSPRAPFSTRYFLLTVIFLVFDIELVLLFPLISFFFTPSYSSLFLVLVIFFILMLGVVYEHKEGSFDWMK